MKQNSPKMKERVLTGFNNHDGEGNRGDEKVLGRFGI